MSGQRSRLIRRAARLAIQGGNTPVGSAALAALESMKATYKEVRRAAKMSVKKLGRVADQMKAGVTLPKHEEPRDD